jgi:SAM-dependent methyltransferase
VSALFFELFSGLPRQGPGDAASTIRALTLVPGVGERTRVLDLGCGTGMQTRVIAEHLRAEVVAIDNHEPFIAELSGLARSAGLEDRIDARVGDMRHPDVPSASFDLVWSEGAIYAIGFENGLREWQRLLVRGGHVAVTEVCWLRPDPPDDLMAFWMAEYPAIRDVATNLRVIDDCGYETVGHFTLPRSAWWDDYYRPLQQNITSFRTRHRGESEAQELADDVQREIDVWQTYSAYYSYEFFVMRLR